LRNGTAATAGLTAFKGKQVGYWGAGIRILAVPAKTAGLLAWTVASELSGMSSRAAVLTPDAHTPKVLEVIARVQSPPPFNRTSGTFGPFAIRWERADEEEAREIWSSIPGADALSIPEAIAAVKSLGCAERRSICDRIEAARILRGESHVSRERLREIVEDVVRNGRRFAPAEPTGRRVMTIHRAKNREFANVVVLWPQTVGGGAEQQRRLLYNAITRAKNGCSVVVFGVDRLGKPPFSD